MMSLSSHTFWIDYESGKLLESFTSGAQAKNPIFIQGDTAKVEVHLLRRNGSTREEISIPAGATLKMGIGRLESQPTAGTFKIGYKGIASAEIPFNASASALETALNGIPDVDTEGGISVETAGDAFLLTWNSGNTHDPLTSDPDELFPSSQVILVGQVVGDVQKVLLHLQQSPVAFLQTFTAMGDPVLTSTLLATIGSKKVYRISIAPNPAGGSFYISGTNNTGTLESPGISVNATSTDVLNALPATIQTDASVIKSGTYSWDISISSANSLTADGSGLIGWLGVEGLLSLNTVQIHEFLNARESAPAVLEVMVSESTGETTILQTPCTIVADLIDEGSIAPLDLTPPLSEGVANSRYLRRDTWQNPSGSEINNVWLNLGVTKFGTDVSDSLNSSDQPSGGNPLITASALTDAVNDYVPLAGGSISGNLTISGRAAIGGGLANNTAHKLAIYNGNIVFSSGFGIAFGDGTTQTTAASTPDLSGYAPKASPTFSGDINLTNSILTPGKLLVTATAVGGGDLYTTQIDHGIVRVGFTDYQGSFGYLTKEAVRVGSDTAGFVVINTSATGGYEPQIALANMNFGKITTIKDGKFLLNPNDGNPEYEPYASSLALTDGLALKADLSGATFSGKINTLAPTATNAGLNIGTINSTANLTNSVAGDVWIGTWQMAYKTANGTLVYGAGTNATNVFGSPQIIDTTNSNPALRITQKGTGFAIRIEDETTPDTSATIIDNSGKMGIQINPASITLVEALTVGGNVLASNFKCNPGSGSAFYFQSGNYLYDVTSGGSNPFTSGSFSHNEYPLEIEIQANGTTYRVPARSL